jgi:LacI family transcriptional regulator, galactose operon repressor
MRTRPTIRDVAEHAGVSPSTVSVVLNETDGARVAPDTRRRIVESARLLGYSADPTARALRTQRTYTVGFVSDVIATTPYAGRLIQGAQDAAWRQGMLMLLLNTGGDLEHEREAIRTLVHRRVDGIVYATMWHRVVDVPHTGATPIVLCDARAAGEPVPCVAPDEWAGAAKAVTELLDHGHRRIGLVLDEADVPAAWERLAGYRDTLAEHGIAFDPALVVRGESTTQGGRRAAARLLDAPDRPTGVFCFNDAMAMGLYQAAAERGLRIPQDLSVVGFDDQQLIAPALSPALTTVALPHYEMGVWAVEALLGRSDGGETRMPCPLIRRQSVGAPDSRE